MLSTIFRVISVASVISAVPKSQATSFDWQKLNPSPKLLWVECFTGKECARFEVPLDYTDPSGDKVAIALLRVKSKVAADNKNYRGPVLFNPGGPGMSGIDFINQLGETFQQILGEEYDIVGFDPRGIGQATPEVSVFQDLAEKASWEAGAPPPLNSTPDALPRAFARAQVFSSLVAARNEKLAQHVGTSAVARDMLSVVKAHGRERLQYWGFSYGSVLGATYAALFPDRVERLIIDGVVDFDDYYSGSNTKDLLDADKTLNILYEKCASAGPSCPLHADSADLVRQRIEAILASVQAQPISVVNGSDYGVIDFAVLKSGLFLCAQVPFTAFPLVAATLAALEQGDAALALVLLQTLHPVPKCDGSRTGLQGREGSLAIECGERARIPDTITDVKAHFETLSATSVFADLWTDQIFTSCVGWKVRAKERFDGSFNVNTSFPLLVIGNTADPLTPIVGAHKAVSTFGGSALLTINTPGHTSIAANSACAEAVVHDYFSKGKLPDQDATQH